MAVFQVMSLEMHRSAAICMCKHLHYFSPLEVVSACTQIIQITEDLKEHLMFTDNREGLDSPECTTVLLSPRDKGCPPHLPSSPSAHSSNPHTYMRAAQPRNSWQRCQGGRAAVLGGCCSLTPPLPCRILPGFPFSPPLVPVSRPACCTQLHKFSEQLSHLPAEPASRGPLPQQNRCGLPLCNICASCPAHFEQSCLCS